MNFLLFWLSAALLHFGTIKQDPYVCTPCGLVCDNKNHSGPGTCENCGMVLVKKSTVNFSNLSLDEFCARLAANPDAIVLDVRTDGEFTGSTMDVPSFGHFKRAINIPVNELDSRINELTKYKSSEVLVYCSHNHRSPRASYILGARGFNEVKNMTGGVSTFTETPEQACLKKEFVFHEH
jgi:rhodanese-related sulfurtransferase